MASSFDNAVGPPVGTAGLGRKGWLGSVRRSPLVRLLARRLALGAVLLFVVTALSFVLVSLTPGDAARQILGITASPQAYASLRHELGLDQPLYAQYASWLGHAISGDLGSSIFTGQSVTSMINERLPVTLSLMLGAFFVSMVVGVALGVWGAVRGGVVGRSLDLIVLVGFAIPSFWLGALLISWFAVQNQWFPATGYVSFADSPLEWLRSLALPIIALSVGSIAAIARQARDAMLDALGSEYVRMAWANGVAPRSIYFRHALKNAGVRVLTIAGIQAVGLLSGTVVVESVFGLPGLGSLAVTATVQHDIPLIQGIVIYFTIIVVVINCFIDLAYTWLNPRMRIE